MLYSYSFENKKRDLADILSTIIKDEPRFISNFKTVENATQRKHEWLEDQIAGRSVTISSVDDDDALDVTMSSTDVAKIKVGTLVTIKDDSALFKIASTSSTGAVLELVASNGSSTDEPSAGDVLNIVSTPMSEATSNGDGENSSHQSGVDYNTTQIFRKEIVLSGTALAINVYGNVDNQLNRQTSFALQELTRDLNRVVLYGRRIEGVAGAYGEAGGLYYFGTQAGGLSVAGGGNTLDSFLINDGAQAVQSEGGTPSLILCSVGQARVLSAEYKDKLQILRADDVRGAYVARVVNEINGSIMTIMADPDMVDTDVWVMDTAGFGLSNLNGRSISDEDATPSGFDGIKRMALGELTFVFKNAKQRLCRISGLKPSATALASLR